MKKGLCMVVMILFACAGLCQAGWLENTLENAAKRLGNRAVDDASNGAYDAAKGTAKGKPAEGQKDSSQKSTATGAGSSSSSASGQADTVQVPSGGSMTIEEAEKVLTRFDFVPGDKTIFFDDFSDTDVGEFPRKWTLSGPKEYANNSVEVAEFQGRRYLRSTPAQKGKGQANSTQYIRLDQKGDLPEKFTVEFDAVFANASGIDRYDNFYYLFLFGDVKNHPEGGKHPGVLRFSGTLSESVNTRNELSLADGAPHRVQVMVNGTFVKAYVDQQRVINDPDGIKRPVKLIGVFMGSPNRMPNEKVMFTNFRLAQGGKDIKSALDTDGKIVAHGILFDTGKDIIKPESLPTLKMILKLMNDDAGLRFSIEGHTDNQGGREINQPLSERRAEAVKGWLEKKGVDPSRLKTAGFGDSKPIDSNQTPEGRANNRRVEFVRF